MDVDTALASVPVNKVALIDDGDFKTREESVPYNASGLDLVWNFTTTAGTTTQTAVTPTTGGVYDWTNLGNGMYAIEIPASGGASINNDTEGFGWFTGFATGILPWTGPIIGFRASGTNDLLIDSAYSATRGLAGTALPAAAADAAGGLPISDAGGLDLDAMAASVSATEGYVDTEIAAILAAVDTEVAAILADTNELQGDWTNGGRLDLIIDAILADTNEVQADLADGGRIDLLIDSIVSATAASAIRTAIGLASANLDTQLSTIAGYLDTEIAAILAAVDTEVSAILADTNELQGDWTNGGRLDLLLDATVALFTTQLTESYRATGAAPTPAQALFEIMQHLGDSSITGTTKTINNIAGSAAKTYELNDDTAPTSITELS